MPENSNSNPNHNSHDIFDPSGNIVDNSHTNNSHSDSELESDDSSGNSCSCYTYDIFDISGYIIDSSQNNYFLMDNSGNLLDISMNILYNMNTLIDISSIIINGIGYKIINKRSIDPSGNINFHTIFTSTEPNIYDPDITENLIEYVTTYDDISGNSENQEVMNQIIAYAAQIKCENFHGKGTVDDYAALFEAANKIATETTQIQLDVDIDGFNEFGQAADDLANLFNSFTIRLQNVNIINDLTFLRAISDALGKICNLSKIFGKFKETIMCKTSIQLPKSSQDTSIILNNVMSEINCAMNYISNFVEVTNPDLPDYKLSQAEQNIITNAVTTIDNWNVICQEGVSVTMNTNSAIVSINNNNQALKEKTVKLKSLASTLKNKLNVYMC
jgi:hypothetical protein